jgi:hypothetical protein
LDVRADGRDKEVPSTPILIFIVFGINIGIQAGVVTVKAHGLLNAV